MIAIRLPSRRRLPTRDGRAFAITSQVSACTCPRACAHAMGLKFRAQIFNMVWGGLHGQGGDTEARTVPAGDAWNVATASR